MIFVVWDGDEADRRDDVGDRVKLWANRRREKQSQPRADLNDAHAEDRRRRGLQS